MVAGSNLLLSGQMCRLSVECHILLMGIAGVFVYQDATHERKSQYLITGSNQPDAARAALGLESNNFPVNPAGFLHLAWLEQIDQNWIATRRLHRNDSLLTQPTDMVGNSRPTTQSTG
jgi:hypothetical protein